MPLWEHSRMGLPWFFMSSVGTRKVLSCGDCGGQSTVRFVNWQLMAKLPVHAMFSFDNGL